MAKKIKSYDEAMQELQQIVAAIEQEEIMVDELAEKVKRASQIIQFCTKKLRQTESEVEEVMDGEV